MKKLLSIFCLAALTLFTSQTAFAQAEIDKGDVLLNVGLGLGYYYGTGGGVSVTGSAEFAINNFFSVGPYLGFASSTYKSAGYKANYTFVDIGARGSYHFSQHISNLPEQLDLYAGASLGYVISSYSDNYPYDWDDAYPDAVRGSIFGGARWYFSDKFAVNGELGIGYAPLILGVTFKL